MPKLVYAAILAALPMLGAQRGDAAAHPMPSLQQFRYGSDRRSSLSSGDGGSTSKNLNSPADSKMIFQEMRTATMQKGAETNIRWKLSRYTFAFLHVLWPLHKS